LKNREWLGVKTWTTPLLVLIPVDEHNTRLPTSDGILLEGFASFN